MARYRYPRDGNGVTKDQNGRILTAVTVVCYLTGTNTPARIYAASAGGVAIFSVTSSTTDGSFVFYLDDTDYASTQHFDVTFTKTNYSTTASSNISIVGSFVTTPSTSVVDDIVTWNDLTGTTVKDSGVAVGEIALKVIAPATNTDLNVPQWNGPNSKTLKNGLTVGTGANNLVQLNGSSQLPAVSGALLTGIVQTWTQTTGTFTAAPASTSTITMTTDLTATILVGMPLKYVIGGVTYYGVVGAITSILLTVNGAPLGGNVTALYYGDATRVTNIDIIIPGLYEAASGTTLINTFLASQFIWDKQVSYLVRYRCFSNVHDSGTHGQASVRINSTEVNTTAGGLTIAANATWYSTVIDIATAAYDINPGEILEITAVKGGTGDASDLTVSMTFVLT